MISWSHWVKKILDDLKMDIGYDIAGFIKLTDGRSIENVTPHKIAVVAFIREFGLLKQEAKEVAMFQCTMAPKYRKDFCMLALKLIQSPDMEFKELESLLTNGKYNLLSAHLQNFCSQLQHIYENGVSALVDCVNSTVDKLIIEPMETSPSLIAKNSVLGFYLRRMVLYVGKLTFEQMYGVHRAFCVYYQKGRPGRLVRTMSKEKLNTTDYSATPTCTSPVRRPDDRQDVTVKNSLYDRESCMDDCCWSRKQAELFVAQQATYLQHDEAKAMPAAQLQKVLTQIMKDIPDFSDVHFVSFLNQLRSREVCGAQDCLYEYFDRAVCSSAAPNPVSIDRNKTIRYAAMNQAAMYKHFGFDELAESATEEALLMAQEAGDSNGVLQIHSEENHVLPTEAETPADIFSRIMICTEPTNYHSWNEYLLSSISQGGALWSLLGNIEMCSVYSQLALNLNTKGIGVSYSSGTALSGAATACAARSQVNALRALLTAPAPLSSNEPFAARSLLRLQHHHACMNALYSCKWLEAEQCIQQLSSIDRWESQLLKGEMYYLKGEFDLATESLKDILQNCQTEKDSLHFMSLRIRAMILQSQLDGCNNNFKIILLNEAFLLARKYYFHYLAAVIELHVANVQLFLGCATQALATAKRVLPTVMANGGCYDMARAILLYTRCRVATSSVSKDRRAILASCCSALDTAADHFRRVEAHCRLRETLYLQAKLYHEIGMIKARNECAYMFRQLDTQHPTSNLTIMTF